MTPQEEMRAMFFESAVDLLQALNDNALRLETTPGDVETVRAIRRAVHTMKGDSAVMGFAELSELAHELEDVLSPEIAAQNNAAVAELVLSAADMFDAMLTAYRGGVAPPSGDPLRSMIWKLGRHAAPMTPKAVLQPGFAWTEYEQFAIEEAISRRLSVFHVAITLGAETSMPEAGAAIVRKALEESGEILACVPSPENWASRETIEVALGTHQIEEALSQQLLVPGVVTNLVIQRVHGESEDAESETRNALLPRHEENVLRVDSGKVDTLLNLVGELVTAKSMLQQAIGEFALQHPRDPLKTKLSDALAFQSQLLHSLQRTAMGVRMVPVEQLFRRFPRLVRDVARQCGKQVALEITGQDTELDKALIDALAEPLGHILRNAVDHGIESPADRSALRKPEEGAIRLNAFHQGNQVVIEIADDGRGIDRNVVLKLAIERGLVSGDNAARLEPGDALDFIFEPGFSTASEVTPISGRGVGMDVVKAAVQRLKGSIDIDTAPGKGTKLQLRMPLTLAILRSMLFRVQERLYAVPLDSVAEIRRAGEAEVTRVGNREVLQLRDELLTIVRLQRMDGAFETTRDKLIVLVVTAGQRKFGLVVDGVVGEQELVIKPLDEHVIASEIVTGASVLGDGTVALVLNVAEAVRRYSTAVPLAPPKSQPPNWGARA